jgi:Ca-activated chloride channel homolog
MTFATPEMLALALLLPLAVMLCVIGYAKRRRRVAQALGELRLVSRLGGRDLSRFPWRRMLLLTGAALFLGVAAAGPRWGVRDLQGESRTRSIVVAVDISKSMLARDIQPNRLERERLIARRVLRELATDRIGLVVFAGRAYVLSPLTTDHGALQLYVDALDPEMVSQGGSSLAAAITQATDLARGPDGKARGAAVVVMSDGEALEEQDAITQAAGRARRLNVPIHTIGIGTDQGERIPEIDPRTGKVVGYKVDPESGNEVVTRLDERLLQQVAQLTGGSYFRADEAGGTAGLLRQLRGLERTSADSPSRTEKQDRTIWFIGIALLLLALDHVLTRRAEVRTTAATVSMAMPARAAAIVVLLLLQSGWSTGEIEKGNRLYRAGKYEEAVAAYEIALRKGEDSAELHYNLGTALLRIGRHDEAQKHFERALMARDASLRQRTYFNEGYRTLVQGRAGGENAEPALDAAINNYKHALRLDPKDMDAKWNLELAMREKEQQKQKSPQGGQDQPQNSGQDDQQNARGGGAGATNAQSPAGQGNQAGTNLQQRPMSREQADRILSAIEQDERELTREKLKKGQRRTAVARDW